MYTPGYGARDSPSARTVVGRDHAYDMGPVVTYDTVSDASLPAERAHIARGAGPHIAAERPTDTFL